MIICLPKTLRRRVSVWIAVAILSNPTLDAQVDRITGRSFATRSEVFAAHGMAATSQPLATQIALDILKAGGSAVDAAIAANAALGLMEPTGCGIGGDLFAIVWDAESGRLQGLNASGRSPLALRFEGMKAELARLDRTSIPPFGMLPISVPGAVDGWFELHQKFGRLPMARLLQPAIEYAEEGFPLTELIAHYWERSVPILGKQPGAFMETFTIEGRAPRKGESFRNPHLASTLRKIAAGGRDAFYRGEIADAIDDFFRAHDGFLGKADLNLLDHGMNLQEAGDAARWQHLGSSEPTGERMTDGGYVELETGYSWEVARALQQMGHDVRLGNGGFGGYQAILRDPETGVYRGASEARNDGQAGGF